MILLPRHFHLRRSGLLVPQRRGVCELAAPQQMLLASGGAFPNIAATNTGTDHTGNATSTTVQLPTGIISGQLLVLWLFATGTLGTLTAAGWTQVLSLSFQGIMYRIADGSEGSSVSVSHNNVAARAWSARITGAHASAAPEVSANAGGTSVSPNPASVTPSWGSAATRWLAGAHYPSTNSAVSAYPSSYTDNQYSVANATISLALASRALQAASEDPGAFTFGTSGQWAAFTLAVRPAS